MNTNTGKSRFGIRAHRLAIGAGVALLSTLSVAGPATASEPQTGIAASTSATSNGQAPGEVEGLQVEGLQVEGLGPAVDTEQLLALRGGDDTQSQTILVDGTVGDNSAENIVSGHNVVSDGSFGNAAGIATVIQNSGSNVLIQNAMNVNVDFVDPGP